MVTRWASKTLKNDCLARFSIPYESGTLEAVSYDAADHEIGRCKLQSAGGTTRLTLDAEEPTVKTGASVLHPSALHR